MDGLIVAGLATGAACAGTPQGERWELALAPGPPIEVVERINGLALADLDGDAWLDLLVLGSGELRVLFGRGEQRFEPSDQGAISVGQDASGLAIDDLDGDGRVDLVISHHDSYDVIVLLSRGEGRLVPAATAPIRVSEGGTPHAHNIVLADVNGDHRSDLLIAQADDDRVLVLLGDGAGGFTPGPGSPYAVGEHPYTITAGDFDGDGSIDLATPNADGGDLSVLLGDGEGRFRALSGPRVRLGLRPMGMAAGDLNGDGLDDLVVNFDDSNELRLFIGSGEGRFAPSETTLRGGRVTFAQVVCDVDRDGDQDVVATGSGSVHAWLRSRDGSFRRVDAETPAVDSQILALGDVDNDERIDIVAGGWEKPAAVVLLGRGTAPVSKR